MQHNAAFHQGLHCLLRLKQASAAEIHHNLETSTCVSLNYTISSPIRINMYYVYGEIHQNTMGYRELTLDGARRKKTCLRGFQPSKTQSSLLRYIDQLE